MTGTVDVWARRAGTALIVGPVIFVAAMGVEQSLRPGFSDLSNTISQLGVDTQGWSYSWIFTASIITVGLLTLVASYGLTRVLGRPGRSGVILLALSGLGCIGVGIFNEDANLLEHSIFALDQFIMSGLAVLFLAPVFARDAGWGASFATLSRVCGIAILVSLLLFVVGVGGSDYKGLVERVVVTPTFLWSVTVGLRLWRLPRSQGTCRRATVICRRPKKGSRAATIVWSWV